MPHEPQTLQEVFEIGGPLMWPLLGASVAGLAVIVERAAAYSTHRMPFASFVDDLSGRLREGDVEGARRAAEGRGPIRRLAREFLHALHRPTEFRRELLEREGGVLLESVERRLPLLRLVVQVSPILGLLGTVQGLLFAFWAMQGVEGPVRPSDVAGGIGSALTTTVFGLSIAIPASVFLLMFEEYVDRVERRMKFLVSHLEEALLDASQGASAPGPRESVREAQTQEIA